MSPVPSSQKFCGRCGRPSSGERSTLRALAPTVTDEVVERYELTELPASRAAAVWALVAQEPGVLGVITREVSGTVSVSGGVDARLEERASFLARLASTFGEELGLEALRELHLGGSHQRVSWLTDGDGSASCVLASVDSDVMAIAKKIRR